MKQGKRKLHLDRVTIRPLNPSQLARAQGGTGLSITCAGPCETDTILEEGSMTANMSVKNCATTVDG